MVRPQKMPWGIVHEFLDYNEIKFVLKALRIHASGDTEWEKAAAGLGEIREKWGTVVKLCRENGFILPEATPDGKIIWHQILSHNGKMVDGDPCIMCPGKQCKAAPVIQGKEIRAKLCWTEAT